jgi:hypothetical protein
VPESVRPVRRLRVPASLAASVLVHLLAGAALLLFRSGSAPQRRDDAIAIEITVEPGPPKPPVESNEATRAGEPSRPAPPKSRPRPEPRGPRPEAQPQPQPGRPDTEPNTAPVPLAPQGPVDLSFDALGAGAKARVDGAGPPAEAPIALPPPAGTRRRRSVEEIRSDFERQADAEAVVRTGRAPPILFELLRGARDRLEPEAHQIAEGLPLGPAQSIAGWGRGYLDRVRRAPKDNPVLPPRSEESRLSQGGSDVTAAYSEAERQAAAGAERRTAEVCLTLAPGRPPRVDLRATSGNAALDRLALGSFAGAGNVRPVPGDVRPGVACYLVRIAAFRMPPLPSLGLGFKNGRPEVIYPLKRITKVTVELRSVDEGAKAGTPPLIRAR